MRTALTLRTCVHDDREEARRIARDAVAFTIGAYGPYYRQSIADQGYEPATQAIKAAWDDRDKDAMAAAVPDELLDALVAAGTPEDVIDQFDRFRQIDGLDCLRIGFFDGQSLDNQYRTLDILSS